VKPHALGPPKTVTKTRVRPEFSSAQKASESHPLVERDRASQKKARLPSATKNFDMGRSLDALEIPVTKARSVIV
jgi:hypothetical protein